MNKTLFYTLNKMSDIIRKIFKGDEEQWIEKAIIQKIEN